MGNRVLYSYNRINAECSFVPMSVSTEVLKQDLDRLTHSQLQQVADFVAFLKFRERRHVPIILDPAQMANLFAEFVDEDRALANAGISDYAARLQQEDRL
jgi:hypothetical protein